MGPWSYAREATVEPSHRTVRACGPRSSRALRSRVGHCAPRTRAQRGAARRAPVRGARGTGHRRAHDRLLAAPGRPWGDRRGRPSRAGARARRACRAGEALGAGRTDPLLRRATPDRVAVPARRRQAGGPAYGGNQGRAQRARRTRRTATSGARERCTRSTSRFARPTERRSSSRRTSAEAPWPQRDGASGPRSRRCFSRASRCCGSCRSHSRRDSTDGCARHRRNARRCSVARWRLLRTSGTASPPSSTTASCRTSPGSRIR